MRSLIIALQLAMITISTAHGRRLLQGPATEGALNALVQTEATVMTDALINALDLGGDQAQVSAVQILNSAVTGDNGPVVTASVLRGLSEYVEQNGCTDSVKQIINGVLDEYNGNTTAFTSALRSLDVYNTNVSALGVCLQEVSK